MTSTRIPATVAAVLFMEDTADEAGGWLGDLLREQGTRLRVASGNPTPEQRCAWEAIPAAERRGLLDQAKRAVPGGIVVEWTEAGAGATRWGTYTEKR